MLRRLISADPAVTNGYVIRAIVGTTLPECYKQVQQHIRQLMDEMSPVISSMLEGLLPSRAVFLIKLSCQPLNSSHAALGGPEGEQVAAQVSKRSADASGTRPSKQAELFAFKSSP